jgi:hypothetical protein
VNPVRFERGTIDIDIEIEIFTVDPAHDRDKKGDSLQQLELSTECLPDESVALVLGNVYGGVTLVSFTNNQDGEQTLFADVQLTHIVMNDSPLPAILTSARIDSFFSGPGQEQITSPEPMDKFETNILLTENRLLNLREEEGQTFVFGLTTTGMADASGRLEVGV